MAVIPKSYRIQRKSYCLFHLLSLHNFISYCLGSYAFLPRLQQLEILITEELALLPSRLDVTRDPHGIPPCVF